MDLATIIGMLGAIVMVTGAVSLGASPMIFLNPISLLIVVGGESDGGAFPVAVLRMSDGAECREPGFQA